MADSAVNKDGLLLDLDYNSNMSSYSNGSISNNTNPYKKQASEESRKRSASSQNTQKKKQKKPVNLTKEEVKAIKKRMAELKKKNNKSTQSVIPYIEITPDGICHVSEDFYTMSIEFFDINYQIATDEERERIFLAYCKLLNYFDNEIKFQLTFENQRSDVKSLIKELDISEQDDDFNDIRMEYSEMLKNQMINGTNGKVLRKYITFGINAENLQAARTRLENIAKEISDIIKNIGVKSRVLKGTERLQILYKDLNPYSDEPFIFDWEYKRRTGSSTKDFIAPMSMSFSKSTFEMSKCYGSVNYLTIMSGDISDEIVGEFLSSDNLFSLNLHVEPYDQVQAQKYIKNKLSNLESMKVDEQKKAVRAGYDPDILPPNLKQQIDGVQKTLDDMNNRNQRLFKVSVTIRAYAENKKKMKLQQELLKRIAQKNNCRIQPLEYLQEEALSSSFPIGFNSVQNRRMLTTSETAVFIPFSSQELFQGQNATYYGMNEKTGNMIMADRKNLKNPNGLVLGVPGSGKSFTVKREILDTFLKSTDDIIICDPEGEYYPLVKALGGQVVKISNNTSQYINPMDIVWFDDDDEDPISVKSSSIISMMEIIVSDRYGITSMERNIVDKCVKQIYNRFFANNPSPETMPTLEDLLKELKASGEPAERLSSSLEMYVSGSQNIFNHRTTVDLNNRIICFDIRDLSNQLRKLGMLIVQDTVWSKVSQNRNVNKKTRYYIDEFHLLLREEQTAEYSVEMWKRFRKWGGVPTGLTQNVKDLLASPEIENILDNSDFVYLLSQAAGDRDILQEKLHISDEQIKSVTASEPGQGLIIYGNTILPVKDKFPKDTKMYSLMTTNPEDLKKS